MLDTLERRPELIEFNEPQKALMSATIPSDSTPSVRFAWYGVGVLFLVSAFAYMDRLMMGFLLEPIRTEFGLSDTKMGMISGLAFATTYVLMGVPIGRMVDRLNRSRVLASCIIIWSITTCLCGFAAGFFSLFLIRIGVGIGEAGLHPAGVSLIGDMFPPEKVAAPMSAFILGGSVGSGLASVGGGALIVLFTSLGTITIGAFTNISPWRLVFVAVGLPGIIIAALVWFTVPDPGRRNPENPDEKESAAELSEVLNHFRKNTALYGYTFGAFIVHAFYSYGWHTWIPAMLTRVYDATSDQIGLYGVGYIIASVLGALSVGPMIGFAERRWKSDAPVRVPLFLVIFMSGPAVLAPFMPTIWLSILSLCIMVYFYAAVICISLVAIVHITPGYMRGITSGIFIGVMNLTGGAFGAMIVGLLSDHVFGSENLGYSLAAEGAVTLPIAIWLFIKALPHFRAATSDSTLA